MVKIFMNVLVKLQPVLQSLVFLIIFSHEMLALLVGLTVDLQFFKGEIQAKCRNALP